MFVILIFIIILVVLIGVGSEGIMEEKHKYDAESKRKGIIMSKRKTDNDQSYGELDN
jgi:hypothetical protein